MQSSCVLAIDLGTSGPKVAVLDFQGEVLRRSIASTEIYFLPDGGAEQDAEEWWRAICQATSQALAGMQAQRIKAVSVTAQWSGVVALDRNGAALGRSIIWMDSRGAPYVKDIAGGFPSIEGYRAQRLAYWVWKTGGIPGHSGKDPIAHILYLKNREPERYSQTAMWLEPKDYLIYRLSGRYHASYDSIALFWATDNRNINKICYDKKLLAWTGLKAENLPELGPATSVVGHLTAKAASDLGLNTDTAVVAGTPDIPSAAVGSGAVLDYQTHICLGTSSWLTCHVPFKKTSVASNMASLPSAIPGRYFIANEQETAGYSLTYLKDQFFFPDDIIGGNAPDNALELFNQAAGAVLPDRKGPLFFPWLYGERTPVEDSNLRAAFFNLSPSTSRSELIRATMEGVALNARWLLLALEKFCKRPVPSVNAIGGGARSALWCQILADVFERPINQMEDPQHAGTRGAAYLAMLGLGAIRLEEIGRLARIKETFYPDPARSSIYKDKFDYFTDFYRRNRALYARINRSAHGSA